MEATGLGRAGFAGGLESHVMHGISDYGDRRTGVGWRDHGAVVAAAYAKALFGTCRLVAVPGRHIRSSRGC